MTISSPCAPALWAVAIVCSSILFNSTAKATDMSAVEEIESAGLMERISTLASDEFGGRAPMSEGERLTLNYLEKEFKDMGLKPMFGDSYRQAVALVSIEADPDMALSISDMEGNVHSYAYGNEVVFGSPQVAEENGLNRSELVWVGYGIVAPEYNWDDYAGINVEGKTVVILVNDPGYATQNPELFNGNKMTYYGRWTYKYEEGARQGAAAVIIVHETAPAAYPWEVVGVGWSGPQIGLTDANKHADKLQVEGWIQKSVAQDMFAAAGLDYQALKTAAAQPGFQAVPLGNLTASIALQNTIEDSLSRNVMARLPGTSHADETVIYTAHWDHLGVKADMEGDNIYNGASDNASGTAGLLSLARLHMEQGAAQRSVVFLAVTAEESGLLGSRWYGENPVYPLATTVANLNMDNLYKGLDGRVRDVAVVGFGNSELDAYLSEQAVTQDRVLVQEPNPEKGYYYRSDHFNFAKQGVPALYLTRATDSRENGKLWGKNQLEAYVANDYHKPSDEYSVDWDLSGAAENVLLFFGIGETLANSRDWPNWSEGTEFKGKRDETSGSRAQ
jgi:Zn-dependent M28 family amino/carboxypeptidase